MGQGASDFMKQILGLSTYR